LILLDTSVLSRTLRRRKPGPDEHALTTFLNGLLASDAAVGLPGIVVQEILSGIRDEGWFTELEARLLTSFPIFPATTAEHIAAARLCNRCLAHGLTISPIDCLIAAVAIAGSHELFTLDDDFRGIAKHAPLKLLAYK
jgi:predicted nucleic acid-binding protein